MTTDMTLDEAISNTVSIVCRDGFIFKSDSDLGDRWFDDFTLKHINLPLKGHYNPDPHEKNVSKANCLKKFFVEYRSNSPERVAKLIYELLSFGLAGDLIDDKVQMARSTLDFVNNKYKFDTSLELIGNKASEAINSKYVRGKIDNMSRQYQNSGATLDDAQGLLEVVYKYVLYNNKSLRTKFEDFHELQKKALKKLKLDVGSAEESGNCPEDLKQALAGIPQITNGINKLRNNYGDAHGREIDFREVSDLYSKLAAGLSIVLATFVVEFYENTQLHKDDVYPGLIDLPF